MIKEVEKLHKSGISWKKIQSFGLGYFWIPLYLQGKMNNKELIEKGFKVLRLWEYEIEKMNLDDFKKTLVFSLENIFFLMAPTAVVMTSRS